MSLYCSISGQSPLKPVVSTKSGHVYERDLVLKYLGENDNRDPITGDTISPEDLVDIKTSPSTPSAPPRPPTMTSVPAILHTLQNEWDAVMLEVLELRKRNDMLGQELSHALYKEDASMRVLARLIRERDEARQALGSVKASLGPAYAGNEAESAAAAAAAGGDVEMEASAPEGLPESARQRVADTNASLSATRRKRKAPEGTLGPDAVASFAETQTVPSLHGTKPPGVSALATAGSANVLVTGGMDKNVQVYDRSSGKIAATLKGHTKKVTSVASSALTDGESLPKYVVSGSLDKHVRAWHTGAEAKSPYTSLANIALAGEVNAVALHPCGSLVGAAVADGTCCILDLESKGAVVLTAKTDSPATAFAFHPDGALFGVGCADGAVRILDTTSGAQLAAFASPSGTAAPVAAIAFSENGYTLASAVEGAQSVDVWDLRKQALAGSFKRDQAAGEVKALAWDASATLLAVAGTADVRVVQHKKFDDAPLFVGDTNTAELTAVAWAPLSQELLVAGLDRAVRVYGVSS